MSSGTCRFCGKAVKNTLLCGRCNFIVEGMRTPFGMNMSQQRAIRFFGKQWDKEHGGKKK